MSLKKLFSFAVIALASFYSSAEAQIITIDFESTGAVGAQLDGTPVGTSVIATVAGAPELNLTALGAANDSDANLNGTTAGFGIDSPGADDSNGLEALLGETITFTFNQNVTLLDVEFENIDNNATSTDSVSFGGVTILGTALGTGDTFTFATPLSFAANAPIVFSEITGDGVSLQFLTIEVTADSPAIPEPSSAVLIALGLSGLSVLRRRS